MDPLYLVLLCSTALLHTLCKLRLTFALDLGSDADGYCGPEPPLGGSPFPTVLLG